MEIPMTLLDCYVSKILREQYRKLDAWWADVECQTYGRTSKTLIMFRTEKAAMTGAIGHHFLA
jgi:hypothetical protein